MNIIEGNLSLKGNEKIAIINGRFNHIITDRLVEGAQDAFKRHGGNVDNLELILVPGAFEIPFALDKALASGKYDAICCVGAVIRGATPHFDYISAEATKGIATVALKYGKPVSNGVLTTDTIEQSIERAGSKVGNKGAEAMVTIIEMLDLYSEMEK
ncbi:6,7-dimethyl-8-ribityllumazine synthase [Poseidonibacter ostreae]|jgi:6,7-dimethyl-8-ribityllumazine synthase|uniref:6,7-dimethyl-8-ribityllumazine synthase n=1 Tax=Poseidonibacter ostreae TaxID=2654171 RepID=A0A6L4WPF8_9BACT|nr:6,7-dimethyl-8-ribityllumazine synthase [Poseidonibacter ostreae]KAB7884595.1 6,7-dimethyl-8-ribityllumazine synthase [Poseidonibacter ostreae]KAB7885553.1 6,7-dimethyl-8-ribityllumazine synthase [Poseidonibacter ostreae]KAB7888549.1 6,7-dimethyl-8-ribityllumazine synthase [Poseidonibacter ostreae]MAC84572.1 6,7-dimethyl-8-ribityllumazine synthase [Arcobacter sp.]|tara:strand:+ start:5522 stop:5992 length:471 start_codon:yes stop_codon:yes gene_type:complete